MKRKMFFNCNFVCMYMYFILRNFLKIFIKLFRLVCVRFRDFDVLSFVWLLVSTRILKVLTCKYVKI